MSEAQERSAERHARFLSSGLCQQCGNKPLLPGIKYGATCRASNRARGKERRNKLRGEGKCEKCTGPSEGTALCAGCLVHRRALIHGIPPADLAHAIRVLDSRCQVCKTKTELHIDHNHETGERRGLLCGACNRALGLLNENPATIRALADYIERVSA